MNMKLKPTSVSLRILAAVILSSAPAFAAKAKTAPVNPDFTKGGVIPAEANHDWTLGATGARGWMHAENFATTKARQIAITMVAKGSPAGNARSVCIGTCPAIS